MALTHGAPSDWSKALLSGVRLSFPGFWADIFVLGGERQTPPSPPGVFSILWPGPLSERRACLLEGSGRGDPTRTNDAHAHAYVCTCLAPPWTSAHRMQRTHFAQVGARDVVSHSLCIELWGGVPRAHGAQPDTPVCLRCGAMASAAALAASGGEALVGQARLQGQLLVEQCPFSQDWWVVNIATHERVRVPSPAYPPWLLGLDDEDVGADPFVYTEGDDEPNIVADIMKYAIQKVGGQCMLIDTRTDRGPLVSACMDDLVGMHDDWEVIVVVGPAAGQVTLSIATLRMKRGGAFVLEFPRIVPRLGFRRRPRASE